MYKRVFRGLLKGSRNFRNGEVLQSKIPTFSTLPLNYCKTLPCTRSKHFTRSFSTDVTHKDEDSSKQNEYIQDDVNDECKNEHSVHEDFSNESNSLDENESEEPKLRLDIEAQQKMDAFLAESPENKKLFKILELEVDMMRHNGERVPSVMMPRDWWELITLKSRSQRRKYLDFKFSIEKRRERIKKAKTEYLKDVDYHREQKEIKRLSGDMAFNYSYGLNFMFRRINNWTMNHIYNARAINAIMFGHKIIIDCGFEEHMTPREIKSCAKQILICCSHNRTHEYPFHIYLCNANLDGLLLTKLRNLIPTLLDPDYPITITTDSYLEHFDRKKLVYLTPDINCSMTEYDPDMTYILGAIVDKTSHDPLTLAKAKKEGIRMAKFPLDQYLKWGGGSGKNLAINQCFNIMQDVQNKPNWEAALKHVPSRKLQESREKALERRVLKGRLFSDIDTENQSLDIDREQMRQERSTFNSFKNENNNFNRQESNFINKPSARYTNTEDPIQPQSVDFQPQNRNAANNADNKSNSNDFSHAARVKSRRRWTG